MTQHDLWCVTFFAPEAHLGGYEMAVEPLEGAIVTSGSTAAGVQVQVYVGRVVSREEARALLKTVADVYGDPCPVVQIEPVPDRDWVAESHKALPPIRAGRFYVYGTHVQDTPPADAVPLLVDANVAFGTGQHDSTRGCLMALTDLAQQGECSVGRALDMGTGTGILAMAVRHLWPASSVWAVDCDEPSVRVARENAERNAVSGIELVIGDGYRTVDRQDPFDLIVANILAEPLRLMAPDLVRSLKPGGRAVLSGVLVTQQATVQAAHEELGLILRDQIHLGDWATFVLEKPWHREKSMGQINLPVCVSNQV